jgi:hypothetical protein
MFTNNGFAIVKMEICTEIPSLPVALLILDNIYILSKSLFEEKKHVFPFYIVFLLHFKKKIPKKKDIKRGDINFLFFFLFGNFLLKCEKKTMKGKNDFFFKKGRKYRALQLPQSSVNNPLKPIKFDF